jgi:hypothetical protein
VKKKIKVEAQNGKPLSELNGNQNGVKKRRGRPPKAKIEAKPEPPPKPTTFIPSGVRWAESDFITGFMNKVFQSEHLNPEHRPFLVIFSKKNKDKKMIFNSIRVFILLVAAFPCTLITTKLLITIL